MVEVDALVYELLLLIELMVNSSSIDRHNEDK